MNTKKLNNVRTVELYSNGLDATKILVLCPSANGPLTAMYISEPNIKIASSALLEILIFFY